MAVSVPNTFTANTKIQSAQVNANFTAVLALTPIAALGDILYASSTTAMSALSGNTTTTKKFLSQTGNGSVSAAPVWSTVVASDVGLTTKGDLLTYSTVLARQAVGSNAAVLIADSAQTNGLQWHSPAVASMTYNNSTSNWTNTNASFADFTAPGGGSNTFTTVLSNNMGTPAAAGSSLPGFTVTLPYTTYYRVTAQVNVFNSVSAVYQLRLVDGSGTTVAYGLSWGGVSGAPYTGTTLSGIYSGTAGSTTFKLQGSTSSGTLNVGQGGASSPAMFFTIELIR